MRNVENVEHHERKNLIMKGIKIMRVKRQIRMTEGFKDVTIDGVLIGEWMF
jgi:hypothetical protein